MSSLWGSSNIKLLTWGHSQSKPTSPRTKCYAVKFIFLVCSAGCLVCFGPLWEPLLSEFLAGFLLPVTNSVMALLLHTSTCDGKVHLLTLLCGSLSLLSRNRRNSCPSGSHIQSLLATPGENTLRLSFGKPTLSTYQNRVCSLCQIQYKSISWKEDTALLDGLETLLGKTVITASTLLDWHCLPFVSVWIVTKFS